MRQRTDIKQKNVNRHPAQALALRQARADRSITEVAKALCLDNDQRYRNWEKGFNAVPTHQWAKVKEILGVDLRDLVEDLPKESVVRAPEAPPYGSAEAQLMAELRKLKTKKREDAARRLLLMMRVMLAEPVPDEKAAFYLPPAPKSSPPKPPPRRRKAPKRDG